jgi:hypothetical protein
MLRVADDLDQCGPPNFVQHTRSPQTSTTVTKPVAGGDRDYRRQGALGLGIALSQRSVTANANRGMDFNHHAIGSAANRRPLPRPSRTTARYIFHRVRWWVNLFDEMVSPLVCEGKVAP